MPISRDSACPAALSRHGVCKLWLYFEQPKAEVVTSSYPPLASLTGLVLMLAEDTYSSAALVSMVAHFDAKGCQNQNMLARWVATDPCDIHVAVI